MATGDEKVIVCHPLADSLVKVPVANWTPEVVHKDPVCVPVLPVSLKKRTPVTEPATSAWNFAPRVTAEESLVEVMNGAVGPNAVHGHETLTVRVDTAVWMFPLSSVARTLITVGPKPWTPQL